jgi:hypothetical protein
MGCAVYKLYLSFGRALFLLFIGLTLEMYTLTLKCVDPCEFLDYILIFNPFFRRMRGQFNKIPFIPTTFGGVLQIQFKADHIFCSGCAACFTAVCTFETIYKTSPST